jgi:hypothetical protein
MYELNQRIEHGDTDYLQRMTENLWSIQYLLLEMKGKRNMTEQEFKKELDKLKKENKIDPYCFLYTNDEEYKRLYLKYCAEGMDNFVLSEAIRIFANTKDDDVKVQILELLRGLRY